MAFTNNTVHTYSLSDHWHNSKIHLLLSCLILPSGGSNTKLHNLHWVRMTLVTLVQLTLSVNGIYLPWFYIHGKIATEITISGTTRINSLNQSPFLYKSVLHKIIQFPQRTLRSTFTDSPSIVNVHLSNFDASLQHSPRAAKR